MSAHAEVYGIILQEAFLSTNGSSELKNRSLKITERGFSSCVKIGTPCKNRLKDPQITLIAISCCCGRFYLILRKSLII